VSGHRKFKDIKRAADLDEAVLDEAVLASVKREMAKCTCEDCQAEDSIVDSVIPRPAFQAMTTEVMNTYNSLRSLGTQAAPLDPITTLQIACDIVRNARHDW